MTAVDDTPRLGYAPQEIVTSEPTRSAKYKWVIIVDTGVPAGKMVNAVACVAAATGAFVDGLIAHGGPDASGHAHPGLPWAGCAVLGGTAKEVAAARARAAASPDVLLVDMPAAAQAHRVYDDYLAELAGTDPAGLAVCAFSVVGPRNRVDKLTKRLALLPLRVRLTPSASSTGSMSTLRVSSSRLARLAWGRQGQGVERRVEPVPGRAADLQDLDRAARGRHRDPVLHLGGQAAP